MESSNEALAFTRSTGSNKLCLYPRSPTEDHRSLGLLVEVTSTYHHKLSVKVITRCQLLTQLEQCERGYSVGRFLPISDDPVDDRAADRILDILIQIKAELDRQVVYIGNSGMDRIINHLVDFPLFQSAERVFLTSSDYPQIRNSVANFERLSFLLFYIVYMGEDVVMKNLLLTIRNTARRLEAVLAVLKSSNRGVLLVDRNHNTESFMRTNSKFSAIILLLVCAFALFLKGYLNGNSMRLYLL